MFADKGEVEHAGILRNGMIRLPAERYPMQLFRRDCWPGLCMKLGFDFGFVLLDGFIENTTDILWHPLMLAEPVALSFMGKNPGDVSIIFFLHQQRSPERILGCL